jgi:hypothetical protein
METKKQTAVDWLAVQLEKYYGNQNITDTKAFITAKAMEKEQIEDAYNNGCAEWTSMEYSDGQHYYNSTYEQ